MEDNDQPDHDEHWEESPQVWVRLLNGSRHELAIVMAYTRVLQRLQRTREALFSALCEMRVGQSQSSEMLSELERARLVDANRKIDPLINDILASGLTSTPTGWILRDPFDLDQPGTVAAIIAQEELADRNRMSIFKSRS